MDYKFTLNLPKTNFCMKASLSKLEPIILKKWENKNFHRNEINKKNFILNDGPPYANGPIHIGHAFNKIFKDFVCKFKFLCGYNINFIPGWDCHGLPIELNVEKQTNSKNINFRKLCKDYANSQIIIQKTEFIRLGIFAKWKSIYKTMDKSFEITTISCFIKMLENKHIYLGVKPNYWCFNCKSALAEAEIEYINKISDSIYFFLEFEKINNTINKYNLNTLGFLVWTTTPWTLPFNQALALNSKFEYTLIKYNNTGYILSTHTIPDIIKKLNITNYSILNQYNAKTFEKIKLKHPIYKKIIPIVFSDHVKNDSGTGCVHIAPSYGYDDYKIALKYKLPIINNITEDGFFDHLVKNFENLYYSNSNQKIIKQLIDNKILLLHDSLLHRYPNCWRHKTPLIFRTTKQWFLNVTNKTLKNKLFYFTEKFMSWIPEYGSHKMKAMFNDRIDWCISRQRFWGIPIMLFLDKNNNLHPYTLKILTTSLKYIKKYGTDFWYTMDVFKLFSINKEKYTKVLDVLDVWFDSSSVYQYLNDNYLYKTPYDLCIEGNDQYRGWFQVSLINSILTCDKIPYKKIISHGFILDSNGRKMSKSLNNVIAPIDILNKYGADILRLWASTVNYTIDINISDEIIDRICDSYRKIRNTFKYLLSNIYDLKELNIIKTKHFLKIDLWILEKFYKLKTEILNDYYNYNFHLAFKKLYNFCINDLGIKYIDLIKDRLYIINAHNIIRTSAQCIFLYFIYNLLKIFSPILSFTTDEAWKFLKIKDKNSVFISSLNTDLFLFKYLKFNNIFNNLIWKKLFYLKNDINKSYETLRQNEKIGTLLEIDIKLYCNTYWLNLLATRSNELILFFQTSSFMLIKLSIINTNLIKSSIDGIYFLITKNENEKCERCWHRTLLPLNLKICSDCIINIYYTL